MQTLRETSESLELLLSKVRGAQPTNNAKLPDDPPSVLTNATRLNQMAAFIQHQVLELHDVIGS